MFELEGGKQIFCVCSNRKCERERERVCVNGPAVEFSPGGLVWICKLTLQQWNYREHQQNTLYTHIICPHILTHSNNKKKKIQKLLMYKSCFKDQWQLTVTSKGLKWLSSINTLTIFYPGTFIQKKWKVHGKYNFTWNLYVCCFTKIHIINTFSRNKTHQSATLIKLFLRRQ